MTDSDTDDVIFQKITFPKNWNHPSRTRVGNEDFLTKSSMDEQILNIQTSRKRKSAKSKQRASPVLTPKSITPLLDCGFQHDNFTPSYSATTLPPQRPHPPSSYYSSLIRVLFLFFFVCLLLFTFIPLS